jgi:hypothetical protein
MKNKITSIKNSILNNQIKIDFNDNVVSIVSSTNHEIKLTYEFKKLDEYLKQAFYIISKSLTDSNMNSLFNVKKEVEAILNEIVQKYGIGVAYIKLHLNGILNNYLNASSSEKIESNMFNYMHIPIRDIRGNIQELSKIGVFTDPVESKPLIIHDDEKVCFFCSAPRQTFKELVFQIDFEGTVYECGFNFAPFGNPLDVFHAVIWEKVDFGTNVSKSDNERIIINNVPNMDYTEKTVPDLIKLVNMINVSIEQNFVDVNGNKNLRIIGLFNGWAGNSVFHQHFQFARIDLPIEKAKAKKQWSKPEGIVEKLEWPLDAYKIVSNNEQDLIKLSKNIIDKWYTLEDSEIISINIFNTVSENGKYIFYFIPRMRNKINYEATQENKVFEQIIPTKTNLAGLEAAGYMLVDDHGILDFLRQHKDDPNFKQEADKILKIPLESIKVDEKYILQLEAYLDL